jgi:nucleolar GTP-binding protein
MNVLYDRDHYKLALGQVNVCRNLVDNIGKDYVRLMKYGDSLYRCKQLKRAALGRMCTLIKKNHTSLAYLEQVRQHLARLPSIDPNERTLIICGYPNVGKSSYINHVTRADVDVQPYAFTTKSLFVGHTDYKYLRWQVIDTPGILDHPLEQRNTIEMQAITALAHLRAAVLYFIDISEQCGYSFEAQIALFDSIRPLFVGKPLVVVLNKIDVVRPDELSPERQAALERIAGELNAHVVAMSNHSEEGVAAVKATACDALLEQRVERKLRGARAADVLTRVHVAMPKPRDARLRLPTIPDSVKAVQSADPAGRAVNPDAVVPQDALLFDQMRDWDGEGMPPGFGSTAWKEKYLLKDDDWRFDRIPEVMDGKNIADFIDPDILTKLDALEREEEQRVAALEAELAQLDAADRARDDYEESLSSGEEELVDKIRAKKSLIKVARARASKVRNARPSIDRMGRGAPSPAALQQQLETLGYDKDSASDVADKLRMRSRSRSQSRGRSRGRDAFVDQTEDTPVGIARRDASRPREGRSSSVTRTLPLGDGFRDVKQRKRSESTGRHAFKPFARNGRLGPADPDKRVSIIKHLNSGKRGIGKTDRR